MKRPSFQFYPGDWLRDTALRTCSVGARGLWVEMLCLMHEGTPYGHLKVKNKVIDNVTLARISGATTEEVTIYLSELEEAGVFSKDSEGAIYSRRMVRDEEKRNACAEGGKLGGNPTLIGEYNEPGFIYAMFRESDKAIKIGISKSPRKRLYKVKQQYPGVEIIILAQKHVDDMGAEENRIHNIYKNKKNGEWFLLNEEERNDLLNCHLKVNPKVNQTLSSSSSSSSSSSKEKEYIYETFFKEEFWPIYPARQGKKKGKSAALVNLKKYVKIDDLPMLKKATIAYAECKDTQNGIAISDAERFLKPKKIGNVFCDAPWRDWIEMDEPISNNKPKISDEELKRLTIEKAKEIEENKKEWERIRGQQKVSL